MMQIEMDDPAECVAALVESRIHRHRNGTLTAFIVHLHRRDGEIVPLCVGTLDEAIALVRAMAPAHVTIRADGMARRVLFDAFADAVDEIENDSMPPPPPRTLH